MAWWVVRGGCHSKCVLHLALSPGRSTFAGQEQKKLRSTVVRRQHRVLCCFVFRVFGGGQHSANGPPPLFAPALQLVRSMLQAEYSKTVIQLAFLVACLYTAVGLLRLGFLIRFLR